MPEDDLDLHTPDCMCSECSLAPPPPELGYDQQGRPVVTETEYTLTPEDAAEVLAILGVYEHGHRVSTQGLLYLSEIASHVST